MSRMSHVGLDLECFDRIYLNGWVQNLQVPGQVVNFLPRIWLRQEERTIEVVRLYLERLERQRHTGVAGIGWRRVPAGLMRWWTTRLGRIGRCVVVLLVRPPRGLASQGSVSLSM